MTFIKNLVRGGAVALMLVGVSVASKPAQANGFGHSNGGAVIAGIAGGLILGSIIGSANRSHGYGGGYYGGSSVVIAPKFGFGSRGFRGRGFNRGFRGRGFNRGFGGRGFHRGFRHY